MKLIGRAVWGASSLSFGAGAWAAAEPLRQGIGALVAALLVAALATVIIAVVRHRRANPEAKHFHASLAVELTWTLIPFLILFALAWPAAQVIFG